MFVCAARRRICGRNVMATTSFPGAGFGGGLSPGIRVGGARYILKRLLGRGEISEVWLAQDVKNRREVTLKFLPAALLSDANLVEKFKEETERNFLLAHRHIAATYEFVRDHGAAAVAVEFVDGWSLATFKIDRPQQRYQVAEISSWIRQLCGALSFAHDQFGIVHCDLKPSNLILNAQYEIKVTDFGIARSIQIESAKRGLVLGGSGGIGFLSPQQVMGGEPSKADDIYSLGATIFDLLTGTPPFYKGEIVAQICGLKPPGMNERLRELKIEDVISPVWDDAVARCLAKNPTGRPQSAGEVLQLLERGELPEPVVPQAEPEPQPVVLETSSEPAEEAAPVAPVKKSRRTAALAACTVFILAAAFLIFAHRKGASPEKFVAAPQSGQPGSPDKNFAAGTGADGEIRCVTVQPDGKILLGGKFTSFNGQPISKIIRLNADGGVDAGFTPLNPPGAAVHAIALQADGKILAGGDSMQAGRPRRHVVRLNPDGTVEGRFGNKANYDHEVRAIVVQPDGKILVSGNFTQVLGQGQNRIVRLNSDGTPDNSFNIGDGATGIVSALTLQPDGKILAAGKITRFDGHPVTGVVRLLPGGGFDETFKSAGEKAEVFAVGVLPDGKILIGGNFSSFNGVAANRIARLNPDGTVDAGFNAGSGPDDDIIGLTVQPDGKIVIGGDFTHVEGTSRNRIARLEPDGRLDTNFDPGTGADNAVWRVALQADGQILIVGAFQNFDGAPGGGIARLKN
jgi:uncharacterized delta-60 repeat protein